MARHIVMDHTGDTRHEFDVKDSTAVKEAMDRFNDLVKEKKYVAARTTGPGTNELVREFDPTHEEVKFFRPLVGG